MQAASPPSARALVRASRLAAVWAFGYGLYRWYYALGGAVGIPGTPASYELFLRINAIAGVLLFAFAVLPVMLVHAWRSRPARPILLALCWIVVVACVSHALIGVGERVASLGGVLTIDYPFWATIDRRLADLQDLFFNEPWFFIEGVLWAGMAWHGALRTSSRRRWWFASALTAIAAATVMGLLSAFGAIGKTIVG